MSSQNSKQPQKHLTCRYWALGPMCPDGARCLFAHAERNRLASTAQQPGTCLAFEDRVYCVRDVRCPYEHRETGVTGLYQGHLRLTGFELCIANIAFSSGFDTHNHEALFDLIWTIKKQVVQAIPSPTNAAQKRSNIDRHKTYVRPLGPPPPHPIYPDRYRPSGVGDNTSKKRKSNDFSDLKFNPVPGLMQKGATKEDPYVLDSDSDVETDKKNAKVKEQKKRMKVETKHGFSFVVPITPSKNVIAEEILKVKRRLDSVEKDLADCMEDMKILFDTHCDQLKAGKHEEDLGDMASALLKAQEGALAANRLAEKTAARLTFGGRAF